MVHSRDLAEIVRQTLREEFKELQVQLLEKLHVGNARPEPSTTQQVSPLREELMVVEASAVSLGQTLREPFGNTQITLSPLAATCSQSHAPGIRNFAPMKTFRATEFSKWLTEVDEAADQKLPASRSRENLVSSTPREGSADLLAETLAGPQTLQHAADAWGDEAKPPVVESPAASDPVGSQGRGGDPHAVDGGSKNFMGRASVFGQSETRVEVAMGLSPPKGGNGIAAASPLQQSAARLVRWVGFETFSMLMILGSAIQIGLQTDHMARRTQAHPPTWFRAFNLLFFVFFVLECGLRIFVYRARYFYMWGWAWNVFDFLLVVLQTLEEILLTMSGPGSSTELQSGLMSTFLFRLVRMLRAVRVIRVLHVMRMTEELRLMVSCILHSSKAFFWSVVLIMLMVYVFGIHFTQISLLRRLAVVEIPEAGSLALVKWYGSVPRSVLSLFQGLTGGVDWNDLADPLIRHISPWMGILFWLYTSFAILCVMNVVTATFVQHAIERAAQVKEVQKVTQASRLFRTLDVDSSGAIKFEEIERNLACKEVQDFFRSIDVDLSEARCLFDMLDTDNSGEIEFAEFLSGCMRLQGPAKAIDLVLVMRELKAVLQLVGVR